MKKYISKSINHDDAIMCMANVIGHGIRVKPVFNPDRMISSKTGTLELSSGWDYTPSSEDKHVKASDIRAMKSFFSDYLVLFCAVWEEQMSDGMLADYFEGRVALTDVFRDLDFYQDHAEKLDGISEMLVSDKEKVMELEKYCRVHGLVNMQGNQVELDDIYGMVTIGYSQMLSICVTVNPDSGRIGEPYFKCYLGTHHMRAEYMTRISFLTAKRIYHVHSGGTKEWNINRKDRENLIKFMNLTSKEDDRYDNWMVAKYHWNLENHLMEGDFSEDYVTMLNAYAHGCFDERYVDDPNYLPSDLVMPDYRVLKN